MTFMDTKTSFWDAHTHVQFNAFAEDRDQVVRRALAAGVRMVNVGTQKDTSRAAVALAEKYEGVYAVVGLHPVHTTKSFHDAQELGGGEAAKEFTSRGEMFDPESYRSLARHPKTVGIGECGLDYFHFSDDEPREAQMEKQETAFAAQIKLAHEVGKPLMVHCRNAFADVIKILKEKKVFLSAEPGVIHFFTGTIEDAKELLKLGFSFTFGGAVTFPAKKGATGGAYDAIVKYIPTDHILSETDAPYVAPAPYRGKRNEPAYVTETVKKLAALKNLSTEAMAAQIAANVKRVFQI